MSIAEIRAACPSNELPLPATSVPEERVAALTRLFGQVDVDNLCQMPLAVSSIVANYLSILPDIDFPKKPDFIPTSQFPIKDWICNVERPPNHLTGDKVKPVPTFKYREIAQSVYEIALLSLVVTKGVNPACYTKINETMTRVANIHFDDENASITEPRRPTPGKLSDLIICESLVEDEASCRDALVLLNVKKTKIVAYVSFPLSALN